MKYLFRTHHERGLVLFIALIALVAISLAAVALIRSVDTATIIAGNLAFKQSATTSGEGALIQANQWIASMAAAPIPVGLDTDNLNAGFYATTTSLATTNGYSAMSSYQMLTNESTWNSDRSAAALVADCSGGQTGNLDCSGNSIRYVIERLCTLPGASTGALMPAGQQCLYGPASESTSTKRVRDATEADALVTAGASPMFRITVRSVGPRNSVSHIQAFEY